MREGRGHYVITARTTVDLGMQQAAQDAMINNLRHTGSSRKRGYTGALVSMEPDGAVRAMVGGLDYEDNQFNRASHARRQPGSSFKLYVYATAFENGMNPRSTVRDSGGHCGNWSPQELLRRQLGTLARRPRRIPNVAQYPGRQRVPAGRPRKGRGDDAAPRRGRREEDVLDGARRHRHHAAAAHGRLRPLRQRRQDGQALCDPGDVQLQGRADLQRATATSRRRSRS